VSQKRKCAEPGCDRAAEPKSNFCREHGLDGSSVCYIKQDDISTESTEI
jgi:hypothetical protein